VIEADLLVQAGCIITMDPARRVLKDAVLAVKDSRIAYVGKNEAGQVRASRTIDARAKLLLPGLIDSHNHPLHYLSKGICDDVPVQRRWRERTWPFEAALDHEEVRLSSMGTFLEMIRHGTTCFSDPGTFYPDAVAEAATEVGIRGVVSHLAWDVRDETAPQYNDTTETALSKGTAVVEKWHGAAGGRLKAAYSLVRSVHVTDDLIREVHRRARDLGVMIHGHLCTTKAEVDNARQKIGMTPLERYRRLGVLGPNLVLVHMGWVPVEEIPLLKEFDVSVCHCPSASMLGGFGCIAHGHFPEMVDAGVNVILGSDACAISRFVDMVRIMYLASCAHKDARADPTVIGAHKALEMATINAARALGWSSDIGSLEVGKRADFILMDADGVSWRPNPFDNPVPNLVYSASGANVSTVVIDGRVVLDNGRFTTVDDQAFLRRADLASRKVLDRLQIRLGAA
jgi:cytosine/adenosine deaminase-related metal-dependent hydrolase